MQYVHIDNLNGTETLSVPIVSSSDVILVAEGTKMTPEYIAKLRELGIQYIYIEDEAVETEGEFTVDDTYEESKKVLKNVLEKHIYKHNTDLKQVIAEAERIMNTVVDDPEVVNNLTEIRNISTDMYSHCINVCAMSTIMALRLRMTEKQVHDIAMGAILHDLGLRFITAPYINVDVDDMTEAEQIEYKKHTIYGYSAIQGEKWLSDTAKEIILMHHEQADGKGFPFNQDESRIRQEVKIVAVCDDFDALISGIGRRKMKIYEAIEYIKVYAGIIYDRSVTEKLLKTVALYPVGTRVVLSDNYNAVVIRQNTGAPERPVVRITANPDGTPVVDGIEKDLMRVLTLFIVDTVD